MSTAHHLIDRFISELHGQKDSDWTRGIEYFVNDPHMPEFTVRAISVNSMAGEKIIYFFNVARPMSTTKKLLKTLGKIPDEI